MSRVNHLLEEFSEQNLLLQMLLGVLSETDRVERLLPAPAVDGVSSLSNVNVDRFLAALLGVVSLRQQLRDAVFEDSTNRTERDGVVLPSPGASSNARRRRPPMIRELMR